MRYINVFANMSLQGKITIWAKGAEYGSREEAERHKAIAPDGFFVYIGTKPADKPAEVWLLEQGITTISTRDATVSG